MKTQGFSSTNPKIRDDEVDEVDGYFLFDDQAWGARVVSGPSYLRPLHSSTTPRPHTRPLS